MKILRGRYVLNRAVTITAIQTSTSVLIVFVDSALTPYYIYRVFVVKSITLTPAIYIPLKNLNFDWEGVY